MSRKMKEERINIAQRQLVCPLFNKSIIDLNRRDKCARLTLRKWRRMLKPPLHRPTARDCSSSSCSVVQLSSKRCSVGSAASVTRSRECVVCKVEVLLLLLATCRHV